MIKALFYTSGGKNPYEVSRTIAKYLMECGFTKGGAFRMPDGRVEVVLESDKEKLINAHRRIKKYSGIEVNKLEFRDDLLVFPIKRYMTPFDFNQICNGKDVFTELKESFEDLNKTLKDK